MMSINDQNNAYRRGVILGLTLAEIMLLILFLLLLTFASLLKRQKLQYENKIQILTKSNKNIDQVLYVIDKVEPAMTEEFIEAFKELPAIVTKIKDKDLKVKDNETTKEVITRAIDKLASDKEVDKSVNGMGGELTVSQKLEKATRENLDLKSQIENVKGQNKNIMNQLNSHGKGADFPPCWSDSNGKPEYIYNVYLSDEGISLRDNKLPSRQKEQAQLPINHITYNVPISQVQFDTETLSLKKWADENECRFYVRLFDKTGTDQKSTYKSLRKTVEGTFYLYVMND